MESSNQIIKKTQNSRGRAKQYAKKQKITALAIEDHPTDKLICLDSLYKAFECMEKKIIVPLLRIGKELTFENIDEEAQKYNYRADIMIAFAIIAPDLYYISLSYCADNFGTKATLVIIPTLGLSGGYTSKTLDVNLRIRTFIAEARMKLEDMVPDINILISDYPYHKWVEDAYFPRRSTPDIIFKTWLAKIDRDGKVIIT